MPQVASPSTKVHAHSHARSNAAHSTSAQDRGTPSLFDNLVDTSGSAPAQHPSQKATSAAKHRPEARSTGQKSKDDAGQTQASAQTPSQSSVQDDGAAANASEPTTDPKATAEIEAAAKAAADGVGDGKPDAAKDTGKADAAPDAAGDQTAPVAVDPSLLADAAAAATTPPVQQPPAAAVDTTVPGAQGTPAQPAFIAATTAQKLEALDGKGKAQAAKPEATDRPAAPSTAAPADDQPAVPEAPPAANPVVAAGAKPAATDKPATKPDAQAHHDRIDAAAAAKIGAVSPTGADGGAASQASAASAAAGTATQAATGSTGSTATQPTQNPLQPVAVPLPGLAIEIAGRARAGKNNFEIRLDPPELGRIQVKLTMDRQGQVTSHLIADRPDTLDLLRRDASGLERALQDAGLKTAGDGLQFSLRDQSFNGQQQSGGRSNATQVVATDDLVHGIEPAAANYTRYAGRIGGVDIRV